MDYVRALKLLAAFALFGLFGIGAWIGSARIADIAHPVALSSAAQSTTSLAPTANAVAASERAEEIFDQALRKGALTKDHREALVAVVPAMSTSDRADLEARMRSAALRGDLVIGTEE
jgi:hypothetical protein